MFKAKRAQRKRPDAEAATDIPGVTTDDKETRGAALPARFGAEALKSKIPPALTPKRKQTAPPDGATIRQQFEAVRRHAAEPRIGFQPEQRRPAADEPSRLLVGRDISFTGEISNCETLIVEGKVSARAKCRALEVRETGSFEGEIEVETAEILGRVEGRIRVRGRLTIHAAGRISGEVLYGELDIAAGGRLAGAIRHEPAEEPAAKAQSAATGAPAPKPAGGAMTVRDKAAPDRAALDKAAPDRAAPDKAAPDRAAPDKAALDKTAKAPSGLPDPSGVGPPPPITGDAAAAAPDREPLPVAVGAAGARP